jgi:PAS domain S-box-containing protein
MLFYGIVLGGTLLGLVLLGKVVGNALCNSAEQQLSDLSALLAHEGKKDIAYKLEELKGLAAMAQVEVAVSGDGKGDALAPICSFVREQVRCGGGRDIYLIGRDGECIVCAVSQAKHPPELFDRTCQRPYMQLAWSGTPAMGKTAFSQITGRPILPIAVPVLRGDSVLAVFWSSIDMGLLEQYMFQTVCLGETGRGYLVLPDSVALSENRQELHIYDTNPPWGPSSFPLPRALNETPGNTCRSVGPDGSDVLLASAQIPGTSWVVVVSRLMDEVLAPVYSVQKIIAVIVLFLLSIFFGFTQRVILPVICSIEKCRRFSGRIRAGCLSERLDLKSGDEVGELGADLNRMVIDLERSRAERARVEAKYRVLYERAVEGIFQLDFSGIILEVNPASLRILGADSAEQVQGMKIHAFYANQENVTAFLARLVAGELVHHYECDLKPLKGGVRRCLFSAQLLGDSDAQIIQGSMEDITVNHLARQAREKLRTTEFLLSKAELHMLRLQLNPHFLFNALNSINVLVAHDPQQARTIICRLADFCRATLFVPDSGLVAVRSEMELIEHYLAIEHVRWQDRLQTELAVEKGLADVCVPVFALQLLVENAIKYGQRSGVDPLQIRVHIYSQNGTVCLEVANAGRWFEVAECLDSPGVGLANLKNRLTMMCGADSRLETEVADGWVTVRIVVSVERLSADS